MDNKDGTDETLWPPVPEPQDQPDASARKPKSILTATRKGITFGAAYVLSLSIFIVAFYLGYVYLPPGPFEQLWNRMFSTTTLTPVGLLLDITVIIVGLSQRRRNRFLSEGIWIASIALMISLGFFELGHGNQNQSSMPYIQNTISVLLSFIS